MFKERLTVLDNFNAEIFQLENELSEMMRHVKAKQATLNGRKQQIEEIKQSIRDELLADGLAEHIEDGVKYKLQKLPQRLEVLCKPEELPEQYQRVKIEADKKKLKAEYKDGMASNFCKLSEPEFKLVIEHG